MKKISLKKRTHSDVSEMVELVIQAMESGAVKRAYVKMHKNPTQVLPKKIMKALYQKVTGGENIHFQKDLMWEISHFREIELELLDWRPHTMYVMVKIPETTEIREIPIFELNRTYGIKIVK